MSELGASLKTLLRRASGPTPLPADEQYLTIAQYRAFTQQMPMMYVMLLTSMWSVAFVYYTQAPLTHVLVFPAIMTAASANRIHHWWVKRHTEPTIEMANRAARKTRVLATLMAAGFVGWVRCPLPIRRPL
ncbi:MAG: hypothetical protein R3D69_16295 [Xanthobacteraceae bacterium]